MYNKIKRVLFLLNGKKYLIELTELWWKMNDPEF